ncbi:MAG: bifunctional folylpolyglutamate synthase/dihydrofolate synthase [Proteobacteria bacterium]|nr:bifunctional folylpolyglutamate synthase/dihydrofolate synthase [Pseudomonadota bacterium]
MNRASPGGGAWERYRHATAYVNEGLIRPGPGPQAGAGPGPREWLRQRLLPALGHPERAFRAIHVTGTAGKGSVATMIAQILHAAGYRTGLHASPYLQVATEKLWVAGRYASADAYADLVEALRPVAETLRAPGLPLHTIFSVALFLEHFRRAQLDIGVVEVGVGGRFDLTNVLQTEVAVLTNVGLDHVETLGPTLEAIAWHKAGVIHRGCRAVVFADGEDDPLWRASQREATQVGATLRRVCSGDLRYEQAAAGTARVALLGSRYGALELSLAMSGPAQARNAALAVAACEAFDPSGAKLSPTAIAQGLARACLPARGEWIGDVARRRAGTTPRVLLDGAHNANKLDALRALLQEPVAAGRARLHLLLGALQGKRVDEAFARLAAEADQVTVTEPQVYGKPALPAEALATRLQGLTRRPLTRQPDPQAALDEVLAQADADDLVVITGSLYLAGSLRERWYPAAEVLRAGTSWPDALD